MTSTYKENLAASGAPTVDDDVSEGYRVGSRWRNPTTGEIWDLDDDTAGAADWTKRPLIFPWDAGTWLLPAHLSVPLASTPSSTVPADTLTFTPFFIPENVLVDAVGYRVHATASGAKARAGLWSWGALGLPDELLWQAPEKDVASTGDQVQLISQRVKPGWYYMGVVLNTAAGLMRITSTLPGIPRTDLSQVADPGTAVRYLKATFSYGSLPSDTSALTISAGTGGEAPVVALRRGS